MLYQEITNGWGLQGAFRAAGRENQFTSAGFDALFEFLDGSGEDIEVDPVALSCEFFEVDAEQLVKDYAEDYWDEDELKEWEERDDIDEQAHELFEMMDEAYLEYTAYGSGNMYLCVY